MKSNVMLFGWNRSIPGREKISGEHFREFVHYLDDRKQQGAIESYETVFLDPHGGDLNGFFLIRAEGAQLAHLVGSEAWREHIVRAALHLQGAGMIFGVTGDLVAERMELWGRMAQKASG